MAWDTPYRLLKHELTQRRDEGCIIPASLRSRIEALDSQRDGYDCARIDPLYDELMSLQEDAALAAREPNDLEAIRAQRPDGPRDLGWSPSDDEAFDRFHGAWTGRAVGCALGKPSELIGLARDADGSSTGRASVKAYLERRGDWPLRDYFSGKDLGDGLTLWCPQSQRENIRFMEPDDDIHYTLVALGCIEKHGPGFEWSHVARYWLDHLPIYSICTAEAQAIETFQRHSTRPGDWHCWATPELTRRYRNPYREWIGAQIRADGWAWVAAGKPELAAELAYRDACWTHERNGIYGEMMFAAMQAAAFVERDPRRLVEIGLSEIPSACRLAELVGRLLSWIELSPDFEACMARVEAELAGVYPVHTLDNALVCVLSLFYGGMDTDGSIAIAVMCGHDTDCNGATVGSIVGAARGRSAFGGSLAVRLNDTIKPSMIGMGGDGSGALSMSDLARRTLQQFRVVDAYHRAKRLC